MTGRRRVHGADVIRLLVSWFLAFLALLFTAWLLPGFTYTSLAPLFVAAAATGVTGMIVRPVLIEVAAAIGWVAVALATLFGQALVMHLALTFVPRSGVRLLLDADGRRPGSRRSSGRCSPG